jgi:hypothetical protein
MGMALFLDPDLDSNLFDLSEAWINRLMPYARTIATKGTSGQQVVHEALTRVGCEVFGKSGILIYMRCGDYLVRELVEELQVQTRELDPNEEQRLIDDTMEVKFFLGSSWVIVTFYKKGMIKLGTIGEYQLFLHGVELWVDAYGGTSIFDVYIKNKDGVVIRGLSFSYEVDSGFAWWRRISESIWENGSIIRVQPYPTHESMRLIPTILRIINEKSSAIDELVNQASQLLINALEKEMTMNANNY